MKNIKHLILLLFLTCLLSKGQEFSFQSFYIDKDWHEATDYIGGKTLLKDVVAASTMYESQHSGEQVSIDVLEAETPFSRTPLLKKRWKVNINGDSFSVISTDAMEGGAGHEITYDRSTGKYSGYGENEE